MKRSYVVAVCAIAIGAWGVRAVQAIEPPDAPGIETPEPSLPPTPDVSGVPDVPGAPDVPGGPDVPGAPEVPPAPDVPPVPTPEPPVPTPLPTQPPVPTGPPQVDLPGVALPPEFCVVPVVPGCVAGGAGGGGGAADGRTGASATDPTTQTQVLAGRIGGDGRSGGTLPRTGPEFPAAAGLALLVPGAALVRRYVV